MQLWFLRHCLEKEIPDYFKYLWNLTSRSPFSAYFTPNTSSFWCTFFILFWKLLGSPMKVMSYNFLEILCMRSVLKNSKIMLDLSAIEPGNFLLGCSCNFKICSLCLSHPTLFHTQHIHTPNKQKDNKSLYFLSFSPFLF